MKLSDLRPADTAPPPAPQRKGPMDWADMVPAPAYLGDDGEYQLSLPTPEDLATEFAGHVEKVIEKRAIAAALIDELTFLEGRLNDPALANHPKKEWGEKRWARLMGEQIDALNVMLIQTYYAERLWMHFAPEDRDALGLVEASGVPAMEDRFGMVLPFIREGPVQERAPIPDGWDVPEDFKRQLQPVLADMTNICVFILCMCLVISGYIPL